MLTNDQMKDLLTVMFTGWQLHEDSWDPAASAYNRSPEACMIEAAGNNENIGHLLYFFSHWSNDIVSMAAHFGVGIADGKIIEVPPPPHKDAFWYKGEWKLPDDET